MDGCRALSFETLLVGGTILQFLTFTAYTCRRFLIGKSKTCVCLFGDGVDVKVRYITNINEKRGGGIRDLCDHPSNATPIKEGVGGKEPRLARL